MTMRLFLKYTFSSSVKLKGHNVYGGGVGTDVRFFPAQSASFDLGLEFILARHWAFALDVVGNWAEGSDYSGDPGVGVDLVTPAQIGNSQPSWQYSLAPAIEYNWNVNLGIIFGAWFTVAGKNSPQFSGAVFALNYYN